MAKDLNLLELILHFWGDYRRHSIRSYAVNVKYEHDVERGIKPKVNSRGEHYRLAFLQDGVAVHRL